MHTSIVTDDGSPTLISAQYGVTYHSRFGAITESAHVFIAAGLRFKAAVQRDMAVLETGLGTGLNAFMTLLEAERRNLRIAYTGLETMPISLEVAATLGYPALLNVPERAPDFLALHRCAWEVAHPFSEHFVFEKLQSPIEHFVRPNRFDLIYFDAFSPQAQPELWTEAVFVHLYQSLRPEGALVTYCAQGEFKRRLKRAGFLVEGLPGPPGKREMTRASKGD